MRLGETDERRAAEMCSQAWMRISEVEVVEVGGRRSGGQEADLIEMPKHNV